MLFDPKWEEKVEVKTLEPWQEILLKAADIIEEKGWCQGAYNLFDHHCIVGAMAVVSCDTTAMFDAMDRVVRNIDPKQKSFSTIYAWNDAPGRTKDEVIAKLREVACQSRLES